MKTTRKIMLLLIIAATAFAVGCTKDDPNNGGNGGGNQPSIDTINGGGNGGGGGSYYEEHEYVDLGLPSGTLWATCNVGANILGYDFRWGEAKWGGVYKYCVGGDLYQLTKYCQLPDFGYNGYIDKFMVLQSEDDAATVNWGNDWHTPSIEQWKELVDYAESFEFVERVTTATDPMLSIDHYIITGPNGNTIYLPACCYMSNSLNPVYPTQAIGIELYIAGLCFIKRERTESMFVRPVKTIGGGNNGNDIGEGGIGTINNHEYVDLGLPSGKLWATCNIGASSSEENGSYFAWAETEPKSSYDWSNYKYARYEEVYYGGNHEIHYNFTKYCPFSEYGYNGFTDNRITLEPSDDAAIVNWGGGWHTPSSEDWKELLNCCFFGKSTSGGVEGFMFVSRNGQYLFLPSYCWCNSLEVYDSEPDAVNAVYAEVFRYRDTYNDYYDVWNNYDDFWNDDDWTGKFGIKARSVGLPIRPVFAP